MGITMVLPFRQGCGGVVKCEMMLMIYVMKVSLGLVASRRSQVYVELMHMGWSIFLFEVDFATKK
jgi:hypothetical protein